MNIGICTSFYNGYETFLPQWAKSVAALHTKPDCVSIYASGAYDSRRTNEAMRILKKANIAPVFRAGSQHIGMGYARNQAVQYCDSEWIMYLDADDTILPNALDVIARYQNKADVICTGLQVVGTQRRFIYTNTNRQSILSGQHGSSSHSVYKKALWHRAPYIEKNDYVEQPFWLGLAQLGASFVGTKEICTLYHRRANGHNRSMTPNQKAEAREQYQRFLREGVYS